MKKLNKDIKPFPQPVQKVVGKNEVILCKDFYYIWLDKGDLTKLVVPSGFAYDGASIPRPVWSLIGLTPNGIINAAAIVHDFCYRRNGDLGEHIFLCATKKYWKLARKNTYFIFSRKSCDLLFRKIMKDAGIGYWKRQTAYYAVRLFGKASWEANKN